jgi:hypothetical protein
MSENKERFDEIRSQISDLLEEAFDLVPPANSDRAESYWYAAITTALYNDHDFLGGTGCSMEDTYNEWEDDYLAEED